MGLLCFLINNIIIINWYDNTVKLADKELFGQPKNCPLTPNAPYPYEINWK